MAPLNQEWWTMYQGKPLHVAFMWLPCFHIVLQLQRNAVLRMFHPYAVNIPSHCDLIWSLCACQDQRGDLLVLNFQFFTRDGRLFHASSRTGARLFLSPGASLAPHPLCRDSVCCAHAFTPAWTPQTAPCHCPAGSQGPSGTTQSGSREKHQIFNP